MSTIALMMIDFQRDFCAPGGYSDRFAGLEWVKPIIEPAQRLLAAARKAGHLVVHTREGYAPDLSDCSPAKLVRSRNAGSEIGSEGPMGRLLIRGEYGHDIIDALQPLAGELVVDKASYGAFCGTNLERLLRGRGIDTLYFAGSPRTSASTPRCAKRTTVGSSVTTSRMRSRASIRRSAVPASE